MERVILVRYTEIHLKGLNRPYFEQKLVDNMRSALRGIPSRIDREHGRIYVMDIPDVQFDEAISRLTRVFGIAALSRAAVCKKDIEDIAATALEYLKEPLEDAKTFKVEAKRSDKKFPMKSPEICREMGGRILRRFHHLKVDVHNPDITVTVEVRDRYAFVRGNNLHGAGGMPTGTGGRAAVLISGGIDSPVASYMMAKRGIELVAVHFASPPYTSELAEMKVMELLKKVARYSGWITTFVVPFTEIQEAIKEHCPEEYFTIIMRRLMMEIAQKIAEKDNCLALITGESVGQVASQTMQAIACTDAVSRIPVFRPLIGMDKTEIVETARAIGTFETSTLPYEDCCTVFTPRHPKVRPSLAEVEKAQAKFDFTALVEKAVEQTQMRVFEL